MDFDSDEQRTPPGLPIADNQPYINGPTTVRYHLLLLLAFILIFALQECAVFHINLSFNLSYWQNRKARIYLTGDQLINSLGEDFGEIPYFLVLQPPRNTRFKLDVAQKEICVFNFGKSAWHY